MPRPQFSVIIPTLNEETFLPNLLRSLKDQSRKDFEVIVVDGRSRDNTVAVARSFQRTLPRFQVIEAPRTRLPFQRNLGAERARGNWFLFVDADSVLMPYFFERVEQFIAQKKPLLFTTWVLPDSDDVNDRIFTLFANLVLEGSVLLKRPLAPGPLTAVERETFFAVGGYDEEHAYNEDVDLGLRLAERGIMLHILPEALYIWSMRRIRREGKMKVMRQYIVSALPVLLFKRPFKYLPGYIMGGHLYDKTRKPIRRSVLRVYEKKLKKLMKELFEFE